MDRHPARVGVRLRRLLVVVAIVPSGRLLAQAPDGPFPWPAPQHEVRIDSSVMVSMRDGVRLSTDLYFPVGGVSRLPVILIRTPYNKRGRGVENEARSFAGHGYAVAVQDLRGKFESEGEFAKMSGRDPDDGYDTTGWLAAQDWSNGKVGTYGCSYLGETQIALSARRHPNHAAAIPKAAGGNYAGKYTYFGQYEGGVVELAGMFGWETTSGAKVRGNPPATPEIDYRTVLRTLPVQDMMKRVTLPLNDFVPFLTHDPGDRNYWDSLGYTGNGDRFDVPALHVDSWYNGSIEEQLDLFNLFSRNAESPRGRDNQFAIISPATHCGSERATARTRIGDRDVGDARFDYYGVYLRWFDRWLKGVANDVTRMPRLQIYVMGTNQWRGENEWPLARTRFTRYYLHSDGRANSRLGTGSLSPTAPRNQPPDRFTYDPENPAPTLGGSICCTGDPTQLPGAFDHTEVETRADILVYSTPVLERGIELTGPIEVVLFVSSSAKDTDFTAKLLDVYPDGKVYNIKEGIQRARYRDGFDRKVWMEPGGVYRVKVNLHTTSNYFPAGHRIRLEVSSSDFPRFERNLNTGGNNYDETTWVVAENTVHHSREYPSHVVLPVIP
ncbi:MAG: CocE/NonD family hydrolase [Gemmatimonadetes bacterium]|nr:CocE/NonD family hydrolase [Gemmatimonadota bacterium]